VHCEFAVLALLKARLKDWQAEVESEAFVADGVQLQLRLPETRVVEAQARIVDLSRGRSQAKRLD
jgi:putative IMPACT (imprinted ancient) family translation regulator